MGIKFDIVVKNAAYYLQEPSDPPAIFQGKTARLLGIEGDLVTEQSHLRLFAGLHPETGERLPGLRNVANRRGAWDITFTSDKASSVLKLVGADERIAEVERKAEAAALKILEKQVRVRVAKQSQIMASKAKMPKGWKHPERFSENMVYARFGHAASRDGDPHSHGHAIVYNLAFDHPEGQFKTIELRYIDRKGINDAYHKEYAKGMRKLGYKAKWDGNEITVKGVPKEVRDEFSQRNAAIKAKEAAYDAKAEAAGKGRMSSKARQKLGLFHRPEKVVEDAQERRNGWLSRLTDSQRIGLNRLVSMARQYASRERWRDQASHYLDRARRSATQEINHERGIQR